MASKSDSRAATPPSKRACLTPPSDCVMGPSRCQWHRRNRGQFLALTPRRALAPRYADAGAGAGAASGTIFKSLRDLKMVGATGIEPVTPSMSRKCSPAELRAPPAAKEAASITAHGRKGKRDSQGDIWRPAARPSAPGVLRRRPASGPLRRRFRADGTAWTGPWPVWARRRPGAAPRRQTR